MRAVERMTVAEDSLSQRGMAEEDFESGGRIQNDQRPSLSSRIICAVLTLGTTLVRVLKRARSSSSVGLSALLRISVMQ